MGGLYCFFNMKLDKFLSLSSNNNFCWDNNYYYVGDYETLYEISLINYRGDILMVPFNKKSLVGDFTKAIKI